MVFCLRSAGQHPRLWWRPVARDDLRRERRQRQRGRAPCFAVEPVSVLCCGERACHVLLVSNCDGSFGACRSWKAGHLLIGSAATSAWPPTYSTFALLPPGAVRCSHRLCDSCSSSFFTRFSCASAVDVPTCLRNADAAIIQMCDHVNVTGGLSFVLLISLHPFCAFHTRTR